MVRREGSTNAFAAHGPVVQRPSIRPCQGRDRRFESGRDRQFWFWCERYPAIRTARPFPYQCSASTAPNDCHHAFPRCPYVKATRPFPPLLFTRRASSAFTARRSLFWPLILTFSS